MIVFRFEHRRDVCDFPDFTEGGSSLTGHGPYWGCGNYTRKPNFGNNGIPPRNIMNHERCAVTVDQFVNWISPIFVAGKCKYTTIFCAGEQNCYECATAERILQIPEDWDLVAYEIDDSKEGIDWRYDNDQVVFNPAFASQGRIIDAIEEFKGIAKVKAVA